MKQVLIQTKKYANTHALSIPLILINSWDEWTETSYLLPDHVNGCGYLEAVKNVFMTE